jgi:CheY-like chemotaxis protein
MTMTDKKLPKVLVVEDDEAIRGLLIAALSREPLSVDAAVDGREALRLCESSEYAVILLDLMMPEFNGFQFLEAFRKNCTSARSIVFVNTAYDDRIVKDLPADRVHAIIRKPFDVPLLAAVISAAAHAWNAETRRPAPRVVFAYEDRPSAGASR